MKYEKEGILNSMLFAAQFTTYVMFVVVLSIIVVVGFAKFIWALLVTGQIRIELEIPRTVIITTWVIYWLIMTKLAHRNR
jgi:hypothetical protein